ncbi:MAG TPA: hypothetical protein VKP64_12495 [Mycobacteriales bacterium]|nr:hypothetical protein [Mycobacteriales bacterium]
MSPVGPDGHQRGREATTGVGTSPGTGSRDPGSVGGSAPPSADAPPGTAPGVAVRSFSPSYWSRWSNGPPADADWFPIGVFDNDPYYNDAAVKAAGLNLYLGLYDFGSQYRHYVTDGLVRHGSHAMAGDAADVDQVAADRVGRRRLWGYQPADEPEMKHYDVPDIRAAYDAIRAKDPTRPIFIGFGKGLSLPRPQSNYFLQGYEPSEYCAVPDVTAADYYGPQDAQHGPDGQWVYGRTMDLMRAACDNAKPIWNFVDVEKVNAPDEPGGDLPTPTPLEIKQNVWLSIIHGATGIVYFCHDFGDRSVSTWDSKCLYDRPRTRAITETNALLTKYAAVLNSPTRGTP